MISIRDILLMVSRWHYRSCLQECLEVVREARGQLTGCKETDDKPPRHIPGPFEGGKEGSKGDYHASALMAKLQCASLSASREGGMY